MDKENYLHSNIFLPDINNELSEKNATYKANMIKLEKFVMIKFKYDFVVVPNDSSWFAYYPWGTLDRSKMLAMNETQLYREDWIGLRTLDEQGKIDFKECPA